MQIISLFSMLATLLLYILCIRISSRIILKVGLRWKTCILFSILIFLLFIPMSIMSKMALIRLPYIVSVLIGAFIHLGFGALYFSKIGNSQDGMRLGYTTGLKITALGMALLGITVIILLGLIYLLNYTTIWHLRK